MHVGFIHLHVDLQTCCLGGHAFTDHLVYVLVEFLHQVAIAIGEILLLAQRDNGPVEVFNLLQRVLCHAFLFVGHQFLVDFSQAVGCRDGAAHVDGLAKHHRGCEDVFGVGLEGIVDFLSYLVAQLCCGLSHLADEGSHLLSHLGCDNALLNQTGNHRRCMFADARHRGGAQIGKGCLLVLAQQRNLAAEELIASHRVDLRQIVRVGSLSHVFGDVLLHKHRPQLLVVAQSHCPTFLEGEQSCPLVVLTPCLLWNQHGEKCE